MLSALIIHFEQRRLMRMSSRRFRPKNSLQVAALSRFRAAIAAGDLVLEKVVCPVCESTNSQVVAVVDRQGLGVNTVACLQCPTLYSQNRLTEESLGVFYSDFYRNLYGGLESPDNDWFDQQTRNGRRIFALLDDNKLLPTSNTSLRVLEIGTGAGGALVPFKEAGCSVLGIDFDEKFLDFGRSKGLSLRSGGIQNLDGSETFDVVILKDVLEHLPDPLQALRMIRESLSEKGILYIQVPGLQALGPLGYRYDFLRYLQVAHICHYTIESLTYLCEKAGLLVGYSSNWGIVVCSRNNQPVSTDALAIPASEIAREEIKRILMRRAVYAIRHEVSSRLPEGVKKLLRRLRRFIVR